MGFRAVLNAAGVSAALVALAFAPSALLPAPTLAQNATPPPRTFGGSDAG